MQVGDKVRSGGSTGTIKIIENGKVYMEYDQHTG